MVPAVNSSADDPVNEVIVFSITMMNGSPVRDSEATAFCFSR